MVESWNSSRFWRNTTGQSSYIRHPTPILGSYLVQPITWDSPHISTYRITV